MRNRLPLAAWVIGVAGLIPFVASGLVACQAFDAVDATRGMQSLIGYGAVILSFLGGVQWGFALATALPSLTFSLGGDARTPMRLAIGVVPSLIGWLALLMLFGMSDSAALSVLIFGFLITLFAEIRLKRVNQLPTSYATLRIGLTVIVTLCLVTVLTLHFIGARIVL